VTELIGKTLGPYKVLERIGEGGMGVVYRASQEALGRYVAVKVLRAQLSRDKGFVDRFRREALAVAKLNHPNILHVYDAGVVDGIYFIAMDYADGGSLKDQLEKGPLEPGLAVSIATQLADALDHAHRQGLIHRDVKPSNVLLKRGMRPMLADFGIVKVLYEATRGTSTGSSLGTPEYMAPEYALRQPTDARTDIYALGIVLYEMLSGQVPFRAEMPVVTLYRHVSERPKPLRQTSALVPAWLEAVVQKALAKRPEERYQRARDMAEDLQQRRAPVLPKKARRSGRRKGPRMGPPIADDRPAGYRATISARLRRGARAEPSRGEARSKSPVPLMLGAIGTLLLILVASLAALLLPANGRKGEASASPVVVTTRPAQILEETPVTATRAATATPRPTLTSTPTRSPTPTATPTWTATPSGTPSQTPTRAPTGTAAPPPTVPPGTKPPSTEPPVTQPPEATLSPPTRPPAISPGAPTKAPHTPGPGASRTPGSS
jgi:serine/threonine protein kinase